MKSLLLVHARLEVYYPYIEAIMVQFQGKSGRLVPATEGLIIDPMTGEELPPTEEGELLLRGPQVAFASEALFLLVIMAHIFVTYLGYARIFE